jgi:hypothetical protein
MVRHGGGNPPWAGALMASAISGYLIRQIDKQGAGGHFNAMRAIVDEAPAGSTLDCDAAPTPLMM